MQTGNVRWGDGEEGRREETREIGVDARGGSYEKRVNRKRIMQWFPVHLVLAR